MEEVERPIEARLMLFIIKTAVLGLEDQPLGELLQSRGIDWAKLKRLLLYHDVVPFAYLALKDDAYVPEDLAQFLKNEYYCALLRSTQFMQEFGRIHAAFLRQGITLVPIKGVAFLGELYLQRPVRLMSDMDFLVREGDLKKAEEILSGCGYRKELYGLEESYWRDRQCHVSFFADREQRSSVSTRHPGEPILSKGKPGPAFIVELHWSLDFKRKGAVLADLWDRMRPAQINGQKVTFLSPEDNFFSLALHARRLGRTLSLKNVYDTMLLLAESHDRFDWAYVLRESARSQMRAPTYFLLSQAHIFLDLVLPPNVSRKLGLSCVKRRLIDGFIRRHTFLADECRDNLSLYLRSHFLLYDSFREAAGYIINIPREQFAKFYGLAPYGRQTGLFYKFRFFYIFLRALSDWMKRLGKRSCGSGDLSSSTPVQSGGNLALFETVGYSMWPFLKPGERLIVQSVPVGHLKTGDIVQYRRQGQVICHRLVKVFKAREGFALYVRGDNTGERPERVTQEMLMGKVVGRMTPKGLVRMSGLRQRCIGRMIVLVAPLVANGFRKLKSLCRKQLF